MKNQFVDRGDHIAIILNHRDGSFETALISKSKLERAQEFPGTWCRLRTHSGISYAFGKDYSCRKNKSGGGGKNVYLHGWLFGTIGTELEANHLSWDGLDCRDNNVIVGSHSANMKHRRLTSRPNPKNTSGARNVTTLPGGKFQVVVAKKYLGVFTTVEEAKAVATAARKAFNLELVGKIVAAEMMEAA